MQAGTYRISPGLTNTQLVDLLVSGVAQQVRVTIPEGRTVNQVAQLLEEAGLGTALAFQRAMAADAREYGLEVKVPRPGLEGYLMPDTYSFHQGTAPRQVIGAMVRNWRRRVYEPLRAEFGAAGRPVDDTIIIASMVEREAKVPEDRALIAAVIRNRLARRMLLQIDATVLYALGRHKDVVSFDDLKVESPYNTYRASGLPPGPICSPGLAAIRAALHPAEVSFLYYVARPDGTHIFARSYEEHEENIRLVRRLRNGAAGEFQP